VYNVAAPAAFRVAVRRSVQIALALDNGAAALRADGGVSLWS
jgi:hypothetical protein